MASVNGNFFNFDASLFPTTSTSSSSSSNILGDFAAIKNGSYKKLLNAYYDKQEKEAAEATKAEEKSVTLLAQDAKELKAAADALKTRGKENLFNKETITTTDATTGQVTETSDYNYDKIYEAAKSFVESYNSMLDSTDDLSNSIIEKKMLLTTNMVAKNAGLLKDAGITIGKDNKLSIDEAKFKKADISDLKTILNGTGSIADKISKRASDIYLTTQKILSQNGGTYDRTGSLDKNLTTGTLVDELL